MTVFAAELRKLAARLELPTPTRADLVRELDADLAALAHELERRGLPAAEARRRAVEMLVPAHETLAELNDFHRPLYLRLVDRFSDPARHRVERALFGGALALLAAVGILALGRLDLLADPGATVVPLLGLGFLTLALVTRKLFLLHVRRDVGVAGLRRGLGWLPLIAVAAAVGVLAGFGVDLYVTAGQMAAPAADGTLVLLEWLRRDTAMAALGLLVGALALGSWLWLAAGVARVARAELELQRQLNTLEIIP